MAFPNTGGLAFPALEHNPNIGQLASVSFGMNLRDWFAGQALPTVIHLCVAEECRDGESLTEMFARKAYAAADAMLIERCKEQADG